MNYVKLFRDGGFSGLNISLGVSIPLAKPRETSFKIEGGANLGPIYQNLGFNFTPARRGFGINSSTSYNGEKLGFNNNLNLNFDRGKLSMYRLDPSMTVKRGYGNHTLSLGLQGSKYEYSLMPILTGNYLFTPNQ